MKTLVQFGSSGSQIYTFPVGKQIAFQDNFGEVVTRSARMPGAHGGWDELGTGRSLQDIGSVTADFWLDYGGKADATSLLDAMRQMSDWGRQRLYMQPTDPTASKRWCMARINSIQTHQNVRDKPHARQRVRVVFQVSDPFWYTRGNEYVWGDPSLKWGAGGSLKWGGDGSATAISAPSGDITVTTSGNAFTLARIFLTATADCKNIRVARIVNSLETDYLTWESGGAGTLVNGWSLNFDPRQHRASLIASGVVTSALASITYNHPDWIRLLPGANTIRVSLESGSLNAKVAYLERYT